MSDWVPTTCMRCAVGCGHLQRGADIGNGIDVVRGDAAHPVNQGLACQRGVRETADAAFDVAPELFGADDARAAGRPDDTAL